MTSPLIVGASRADITPTELSSVFLAGFGNNRKADRVLDPLFARVLYISDGRVEWVLVALDLIGAQGPVIRRFREAPGDPSAESVWIACTHTHSGPDTLGLWGHALLPGLPISSGIDSRYVSMVCGEIAQAVRCARRRARPARIEFGVDRSDKSDVTMNVRETGLLDHDLSCLVFRSDRTNSVIATLVGYASHPEFLWSGNSGVSPDWPAAFHKVVEKETGGVSIFLNGALGAMVTPNIDEHAPLSERLDRYGAYGRKIAEYALRAAASARPSSRSDIEIRETAVTVPLDNHQLRFVSRAGIFEREFDWRGTPSSVCFARIGGIPVLGIPGELCPRLGLEWKRRFGCVDGMLVTLCNDELGYLMPETYFDDARFRYECTVSPGPRTAGTLADAIESMLSAPT